MQYAQFQLFSLKYQTLQRPKKSTLSSSSDTTEWNNPFLVNQIRAPIFKLDPMLNILFPLFYPVQNLCVRVWKRGRGGRKSGSLFVFYSTELPLYTMHSKEHSSWKSADCIPHFAFMYSPEQFITFPTSSSEISKGTSCQWTSGQLSVHIGMHHYFLVLFWAWQNRCYLIKTFTKTHKPWANCMGQDRTVILDILSLVYLQSWAYF